MKIAIFALSSVMLVACSSVTPMPADVFLPLEIAAPATSVTWTHGDLRVAPFTANGVHNERAVMMTTDGATLQRHPYWFWASDPPHLLQDALQSYLAAAHIARHVDSEVSNADRLIVHGSIERLDYHPSNVATTAGSLMVSLSLKVLDIAQSRVVMSREFRAEQPVADGTATALAHSMNTAVSIIYADFLNEAAKSLKSKVAEE